MRICDRCSQSNNGVVIQTIPIQFPNEKISYLQLCPDCMVFVLKIIIEQLLDTSEILSFCTEEKLSRAKIFNNIIDEIKRMTV